MKKIFIIITIGVLILGAATAVYANGNVNSDSSKDIGFSTMMGQNSIGNQRYNEMIDLMSANGFEEAAKAMETRDFDSMSDFMNNLTDNEYDQMIEIMRDNGYESMANMMGSVSRQEMLNMHNSMMGR